ncbi:hypothetical protein FTUN_7077 [Frigoriglobus tundricola]|uniref:Uncharacterized protein n=1 Tax=Frigoriglobus tundricola TaxID=2774151 RepID=A0A6M5YZT9_9BACT|nr:hypothetical protein FTUN_7077 [Frigoriglobus tundricola]
MKSPLAVHTPPMAYLAPDELPDSIGQFVRYLFPARLRGE